jgi:hypothetical protein
MEKSRFNANPKMHESISYPDVLSTPQKRSMPIDSNDSPTIHQLLGERASGDIAL